MPVEKSFVVSALAGERRRTSMNRSTRRIGSERLAFVADGAGKVQQAAEHLLADRHLERSAGRLRRAAPRCNPDVDCSAMARTVVSSKCDCTSP